eukprot:Gb_37439 [translate_table: standard]
MRRMGPEFAPAHQSEVSLHQEKVVRITFYLHASTKVRYRVERCRIMKKGGGSIELEPCTMQISAVAPTFAPSAMEWTMTTTESTELVEDLSEIRNLRIGNGLLLEKLKKVEFGVRNKECVKDKVKLIPSGISLRKVLLMPTLPPEADLKRKHINNRSTSNYSYEDVEVLEEEIEEESLVLNEWVKTTDKAAITTIAGNSPDDDSPVDMDNENGLLSPPLDKDAFLPIQSIPKDIGKFFDRIDDEECSMQQCTDSLKKMTKPSASSSKIESTNDVVKLEAARKRLQEGYRQAKDVKKKQTVQMAMELPEAPKYVELTQNSFRWMTNLCGGDLEAYGAAEYRREGNIDPE